ncbi:hypothetical protein KOI35_31780 [Actinoplanes bogorensis]|uniref:Secreted protein n=1 Tax=Paractinoplanes bogorensis TaxID=1610840 RepID=A0ABS5Z132_9ACTN|nr:hypothetical protein [Actinoplanes bogorensis]MBU2668100.1 hypothetical protein [Actinoplanes bogorensis]
MSVSRAALRGIALTASVAAAILSLQATPAAAKPSGGSVVVVSEPGVVTVTKPDPAVRTKVAPAIADRAAPAGRVALAAYVGDNSAIHCQGGVPPCQFNIHKEFSRTITPGGGSSGQLRSKGTAFVDAYTCPGCGFRQADYYNTTSTSGWYGSSPFNANSVKHSDVWDIDYTAIGWEFSGTPAGTLNLGSGRLSYENSQSDTWYITHNVAHVKIGIRGWPGSINRVKYEAHGGFQFGSTYYTTDAYSSVALT